MRMVKSNYSKEKTVETTILKAASLALKDPIIEFRLLGGMSNYTYVVKSEGKLYTVRILGEHADKFVWRHEEKYHLQFFEKLGITSHTIYFDDQTGVKVSEFIEGQILSHINPLDHLEEVANLLHTIHDAKLQSNYDYQLFERLDQYEKINHHLTKEYFDLKNEMIHLYQSHYSKYPHVLIHGDAQPSNFIIGKDKNYIVDFEFSGNNDPYYDLACFGNIDFSHALALLEVYLKKKPTNEALKRLYYYRIFQCLQWHLVAKFKHEVVMSETLKIPFDKASLKYLHLALSLKERYDLID